jgi:peptidoglycan/xylan/chitin deacetylase (PgdA/CDA1 family)
MRHAAQALLQRINNEGHTIGSHTVDHISLDNLDTDRIEYELSGLESTLESLGISAPKVGTLSNAQFTRYCE